MSAGVKLREAEAGRGLVDGRRLADLDGFGCVVLAVHRVVIELGVAAEPGVVGPE